MKNYFKSNKIKIAELLNFVNWFLNVFHNKAYYK
jgi:hypothetical protein